MSTYTQAQAKAPSTSKPSFAPAQIGLLQRKCACGGTPGVDGECAECRRKRLTLQRRSMGQAASTTVPPTAHNIPHSSDQFLKLVAHDLVEPGFGHNFSQMRIHTNAQVANQITESDKQTVAPLSSTNQEKGNRIVRKGQTSTPPASSAAPTPVSGAGPAPALPTCTFSVDAVKSTFSREGTTPSCRDLCGAEAIYRYTRVHARGSGCPPSLEGLFLTEDITTDHGCGGGEIEKGWAVPLSTNGTLKLKTADHFALCSNPDDFPKGGCIERYTQKLLVGNRERGFILAETHTITFHITKSADQCSGTVTRT